MSDAFSPSKVVKLVENSLSVDNLRDWRRRGLLDGIGQQDNRGRWNYSIGEVLFLSSVPILIEMGLELKTIFDHELNFKMYLHSLVRQPDQPNRFMLLYPKGNQFSHALLEQPNEMMEKSDIGGFLFSLEGLVQRLPSSVKNEFRSFWNATNTAVIKEANE
ncbi:hypothetical protein SAMN04488056_10287 [Cohaesibacter marisflavi]|uniref:HTH merR-type domain-containing protein n=1 Tax=Cohaesibacter marisflavi TaxID=655353 RepID=A0A1I5C1Z5_9HYPH|nr:hypothetical protein [Cohaesibacter marisflavi]SFN80988.1 hypothetical protein SAMN04488056_10287 [Cohaesibacter marisflavi]